MDLRDFETAVPFERTLDGVLGVEYDTLTPERVSGHMEVGRSSLAPHGAVPLGVYAALAEGAASMGTAAGVVPEGNFASGMTNDTTVTATVDSGTVRFEAVRQANMDDLWVWNVECTANGETCALSRVQVAVRPPRR